MRPAENHLRRGILILTAALIVGVVTGGLVYRNDRDTHMSEAFSLLSLYHDLRKAKLEDYMRSKASDVRAMGRSHQVTEALEQLELGWSQLGGEAAGYLRRLYIDDNPFPIGERRNLRRAGDESDYTEIHQHVHDWAKRFLDHFGYHDLFLIDRFGNIVYTVEKEDDFATNLRTDAYVDSPLGFVFQRALKSGTGRVVISDYERYAPSNNAPALFAGTTVKAGDGSVVGVFAVQLPTDPINALLMFSEDMGQTGEVYVVGNDFTMRSQSRFSSESTVLETKVETPSVVQGLAGFEGSHVIPDYRGVPVLSAYSPVDFAGPPWVMVVEVDRAEVLARLKTWPAVVAAFIASILAGLITYLGLRVFRRG